MEKIVGHGVDIIDLEDFKLLFEESDAMKRCFTDTELKDIGDDTRSLSKAAGRFAVKEAVLKALGEGWGEAISWKDVEVNTASNGAPSVVLYRRVQKLANDQRIFRWLVTTSHSGLSAVASVIAVGD
ncbi:MAG: holo-ACP synthase [Rhodospirillales bacterium]|nr:holo-ACP synthase [Rhodospirillales bacterium]